MAVAFDAFTANANQTADFAFNHTPVGTPRAVIVWVVETGATADHIAGITYGGDAMTEVSGSPNILATGETGIVYCYFLGTSIPTGVASVSVDTTATSNYIAYCVTLTAGADTEIVDSDGTINSTSQANPSVTLSLSGKTSFAALALHSGQQAIGGITPLASWNSRSETDRGATQAACYTFNTIGTSDVTAGWTQTADDACAVCVAVSEIVTLIERSISESISISPAVVRLKTANRSISESITISPAVAEAALKFRDIAQSITISAAIAASKILPRAINETITLVDSISRLLTANRSIAQTITLVDSLTRIASLNRVINQTLSISASIEAHKLLTRAINETISIVDSLTKVATYNRAIAQAISIIDSVTKVSLHLRTVTQNISIVDSLNRMATKMRTINQSIGISDLVERVFISGSGQLFHRTINETITIADAINRTFIAGIAPIIKMIGGAGGRRLKRWNLRVNRLQRFKRWFPR